MLSETNPGAHRNAAPAAGPRLEIQPDPSALDAAAWNALLARQRTPTPFMRAEYLAALHASGSAVPETGWASRFLLLWDGAELAAACPLYLKAHSYGEYVFDWAWANAYAEHGLDYYPKALVAVPFTPVPGARLLARDAPARAALLRALLAQCRQHRLSSLHVLYGDEDDQAACADAGLMPRHQVQFHWKNMRPPRSAAAPAALPPEGALAALGRPGGGEMRPPRSAAAPAALALQAAGPPESAPLRAVQARTGEPGAAALSPEGALAALGRPFADFEDFLAALTQDKRKKIRRERRKVREAGVRFRWARGADITADDWAFFYRCYDRTYLEHGNAPYLTPAFFDAMARDLAGHWVLFVAERDGRPIACSLIAVSEDGAGAGGRDGSRTCDAGRASRPAGGPHPHPLPGGEGGSPAPALPPLPLGENRDEGLPFDAGPAADHAPAIAYGRYWGALERVDCLHFEACYYQPIEWCIRHGVARFEGGAQGEHKMARALLPVTTTSGHWLAHPAFADAVAHFLAREDQGMERYLARLQARSPLQRG